MTPRRLPWIAAGTCAAGLAVSFVLDDHGARLQWTPGSPWWTRFTGQLAHWSARMALLDLGVLLLAGAWIEVRARTTVVFTLLASFAACGTILPWCDVEAYRGSSGVATALFTALLLRLAVPGSPPSLRRPALVVLALLFVKIAWEATTGHTLVAGPMQPGVKVVWQLHLTGALAGAASWLALRSNHSVRDRRCDAAL